MVDIQPGDLIFVRGKELHRADRNWLWFIIAWLISAFTSSPYTHVAVIGLGGKAIDADLGHPVMGIDVTEYRFCDIYRVTGATDEERERAVLFCLQQLGKKYDLGGVLGIAAFKLFGVRMKRLADPKKWFCSELADAAWRLYKHPARRSPGDLIRHPRVKFLRSVGSKEAA